MEHHSNIVPWQMLCEEKGARFTRSAMNDRGELILEEFEKLLGPKTKIVAMAHLSNALGTINPVPKLWRWPTRATSPFWSTGAQAGGRGCRWNVQALDCDFYAISSHKLYGPTGMACFMVKTNCLRPCRRTRAVGH